MFLFFFAKETFCQWRRWWRRVHLLSKFSRLILNCSVRPIGTCIHADGLLQLIVTLFPLPHFLINLSKATKLKNVTFICPRSPQWVANTLRTITPNHRNLQRIWVWYGNRHRDTYRVTDGFRTSIRETNYQGWLELDRLLVELWESHSVRLMVLYGGSASTAFRPRTKLCTESLFPEITVRGIVELINYDDLGSF